jgi:pyocin large subunit-like protein
MSGFRTFAALCAGLGLAACGNGDSAVETRDRAPAAAVSAISATTAQGATEPGAETAETPTPLTANRRETVDEKIQRLYERNGTAFDARSPEDYLAKITAFTTSPPSGTDRATRPNGDVLLYHASTNTFAVVDREGTPRTMFKPDEGEAYWAEQKAVAPTFGQRRSNG